MIKFDMAFSLNRSVVIEAHNVEVAEKMLEDMLIAEGIDPEKYSLEVFDTQEVEEEQLCR